jgi:hypothetical protein
MEDMTINIVGETDNKFESFPVIEINNFITEYECNEYICYIKNIGKEQIIMKDANIIKKLNDKIKFLYDNNILINPHNHIFVKCSCSISLCMYDAHNKIGIHKDRIINDPKLSNLYKFFIYLNDDNVNGDGGTVFYNNNLNIIDIIKRKTGKAVIFDIKQYHEGQTHIQGTKYLFGLRLQYKRII